MCTQSRWPARLRRGMAAGMHRRRCAGVLAKNALLPVLCSVCLTEMAASGALFVGVCSVRTWILRQDKLLDVQYVWGYLTGRRCEESIHHCHLLQTSAGREQQSVQTRTLLSYLPHTDPIHGSLLLV